MNEVQTPFVVDVLKEMRTYLVKNDDGFHTHLTIAYCGSCDSITSVGGDYHVFSGRDCLGSHYNKAEQPEGCLECNSRKIIPISVLDLSGLVEKYGQRMPKILINAIDEGYKKMCFPTLYNENLPEVFEKWKDFSEENRIKQINKLLEIQKELHSAEEKASFLVGSLMS